MIKGFRDFILRGNVIELAIAVVIGSAFTALVGAFTANIINPVIASAGGVDAAGWGFPIRPGNDATFVDVGAVLTAIITFGLRSMFFGSSPRPVPRVTLSRM